MSDDTNGVDSESGPKKKSKGPLIAIVLALLLGGGAFYGVYSGMVPLPFGNDAPEPEMETARDDGAPEPFAEDRAAVEADKIAFVPLEEMVISLGPNAQAKHLKVRISIEVNNTEETAVTQLTPRILDVLNTYLRAVDERDLEAPHALARIRAHMLRRVQLVTPQGSVRDVLIQEFILN
ncbi:MAG: flagellar basal body-associated FliL family protein [Pseudomonadota bacterium]